jgi:hypothetical protein
MRKNPQLWFIEAALTAILPGSSQSRNRATHSSKSEPNWDSEIQSAAKGMAFQQSSRIGLITKVALA